MMKKKHPKDVLQMLQNARIPKTAQRRAVLELLLTATRPLSAMAIVQKLKARSRVDKVTVYRILSLFRARGMIREIPSSDGTLYFEMAMSNNPQHPHFNCRICGSFTCLEPASITQEHPALSIPDNFRVDNIQINISGLCATCLGTQKAKPVKWTYKKRG
ncbi:MAG TPA: Fur family transcriptional regulator [Smithella sp.]|nr:Fur family transcriptional regulator [Smithella sp.]